MKTRKEKMDQVEKALRAAFRQDQQQEVSCPPDWRQQVMAAVRQTRLNAMAGWEREAPKVFFPFAAGAGLAAVALFLYVQAAPGWRDSALGLLAEDPLGLLLYLPLGF